MLVLQLPALLCEPQDRTPAQTLSPSFVLGQATATKDNLETEWMRKGQCLLTVSLLSQDDSQLPAAAFR